MTQQLSLPRRRTSGKLATTTYANEIVDFVDKTRPVIETGLVDGPLAFSAKFCRVQQVGGVAGSDVADCTFTYDLYQLDNVKKINVGQAAVTPKGPPRAPKVAYTAATYALYCLDYDKTWLVFLLNENYATEDCAA